MSMYVNYSTNPSWGTIGEKSIPASRFQTSVAVSTPTKAAWIALASVVLAALITMGASSTSTVPFWLATGALITSTAALTITFAKKHFNLEDERRSHQYLDLPSAADLDTYKTLLATDKGATYSFKVDQWVSNNLENEINLNAQTTRELKNKKLQNYYINSKRLVWAKDEDVKIEKFMNGFHHYYKFANQMPVADMQAILCSRYKNTAANIDVVPRQMKGRPTPNTHFKLVEQGEKRYLEISQLFQICKKTEDGWEPLKHIKAVMQIDISTNQAVISWTSPQDDLPDL